MPVAQPDLDRLGFPRRQFLFEEKKAMPACMQERWDEATSILRGLGATTVDLDVPDYDELTETSKWTPGEPAFDSIKELWCRDFKAELPLYLEGLAVWVASQS
jgi:hypothetical protein